MRKPWVQGAFALTALLAPASGARAELQPHFDALKPFLGRTWRGTLPNSTPEKPVVDVARYEAALGGHAVRIRHSVNDGDYGGEILVTWDQAKKSLVYYYFTTGGFYTEGTMRVEGGTLVTHEIVRGDAGGVSEVKGESRLDPDGRLRLSSRYLRNGVWGPGRETIYVEDPQAVVRFKE